MLLEELYHRAAYVLARGAFKKETPKRKSRRFIREVIQLLKNEISEPNIRRHLDVMPYSYFLGFSPEKIVYHVKLFERFGEEIGFDVIYNQNEGYDEFTFWGFDKPGVFSKLCGVLAGSGINILGARIITRDDGRIVDVFYVNRLGKSTSEDNEIWNKVSSNLYGVLKGEMDVEHLVSKRKRQKPVYIKPIPQHPTRIDVDNESSDTATVIDIYTNDRVGLLYDITKTLTKLGLSVDYAKISTKVDQVADVFYVREIVGGKVFDEKKLENIKNKLIEAIDIVT
jgi:[protein-PII] uridylyltransferase